MCLHTRKSIFLTQHLGRVRFTKIQRLIFFHLVFIVSHLYSYYIKLWKRYKAFSVSGHFWGVSGQKKEPRSPELFLIGFILFYEKLVRSILTSQLLLPRRYLQETNCLLRRHRLLQYGFQRREQRFRYWGFVHRFLLYHGRCWRYLRLYQ